MTTKHRCLLRFSEDLLWTNEALGPGCRTGSVCYRVERTVFPSLENMLPPLSNKWDKTFWNLLSLKWGRFMQKEGEKGYQQWSQAEKIETIEPSAAEGSTKGGARLEGDDGSDPNNA